MYVYFNGSQIISLMLTIHKFPVKNVIKTEFYYSTTLIHIPLVASFRYLVSLMNISVYHQRVVQISQDRCSCIFV